MRAQVVLEGLDHVLMATGRKPNTRSLGLEEVGCPPFENHLRGSGLHFVLEHGPADPELSADCIGVLPKVQLL